MIATLKMRLKPTKDQEAKFYKFSHTARWAYNWGLATKRDHYDFYMESLNLQDLLEMLQNLKYDNPNYSWLHETPESVTKQSLRDLEVAYNNFFNKTSSLPVFKRRQKQRLSFYQRTDKLKYWEDTSQITVTGVGRVRVKNHYGWFPEKVLNSRISHDRKYWYLTVSCEVGFDQLDLTDQIIGVDLGVNKLAVRSDGVEVYNINKTLKVKKLYKRLKRLKEQSSRKYDSNKKLSEGGEYYYRKSKNYLKIEREIKLLYRRLKNIRNNHIHHATSDIVKTKPCKVVVEDLDIIGMFTNEYITWY